MARTPWLTLARLYVLTTLTIAVAGGAAFAAFLESSRQSLVERSDALRDAEARRVEERLATELAVGGTALDDIERAVRFGALRLDDPGTVEARLFSELLDHPTLSDVTLTHATGAGFAWQISVFRASADPRSAVLTRRIAPGGSTLVAAMRLRSPGAGLSDVPFELETAIPSDPTTHDTYEATVAPANYGRAIWSDLAFSELDAALPEAERRVVLTVQKVVEDPPGKLAGVLRVGLLAHTIDALPRLGAADIDPAGPQRVVLCDAQGRLVARLAPGDRFDLSSDDLRVVASQVPPEIAAALAHPGQSGAVDVGGVRYLVTFRPLKNTQSWQAGVVVPEEYYTRDLRALRDRFLGALVALTVLALLGGAAALRPVRRSLARVVEATGRMRRFELAPSTTEAPLREVAEVMEGVERAKTSMRALGKYVPMDLVRELHAANREPELGGELVELSMMFTDIEGFTTLSERLAPDALARALGLYFEAMTSGVRSTGGTLDKFIGDAVMAFWNAPTRRPDHARRACLAALACLRATRALYASAAWDGLPPLFTRFGLHTARVMVGHFGAPERLSYTALGDGVNLAARLEGLCKHYGVAALASEATVAQTKDELAFRLIDKVAVKGKHLAVRVYELLGAPSECAPELELAGAYESALGAYFSRDFTRAREILRTLQDDPPSRVLAARCEALLVTPPPSDWEGVYVARSK